ncbi:guanylate kinase [Sulfobacillus thermosulfidooxidans DSM 9293]|uniref:Guanylate kinase n=2 Tax=Sulfobacillus thermosulfidooxidans TaxID=28034 RepID=A0A1W1WE24_SULTA|nr:guanylate kinase [Sulfobacillus thermosulfidooxidans]PSR27056.1 MAG: guanylate kinase [Sulfobacillus thermosulfidooxidans]SMC04475.1 guanylate kinase [Sulfobacillus thermosulfidooxidans DSM 9293]
MEPILFIFTGPSGAGKGSVMRALLQDDPTLHKVVTFTTRAPRQGEIDGFDYRFVSVQEFLQLVEQGQIFEYENVYRDHYYGSPRELFVEGRDGIMELDYKGRLKYQERLRRVVSIFLLPPSLEELKKRILSRSKVSNLAARLDNAVEQLRHAKSYDYIVKNDDLATCIARVKDIIRVERLRRDGQYQLDEMIHQLQDDH